MSTKVMVNEQYCPQNHHCPVIRVCPAGAITQDSPFSAPTIDQSKCTSCGRCTMACNTFSFAS